MTEAPRQGTDAGSVDRRWLFGSAVLDERTLELQVDGKAAELERKSLQVLMHLLNHAGEVVTKDELLAGVWPGRILSDSVITSCMARLRDALRDEDQSVIKTVHGFGYRLIAPVKVETSGAAPPARFEFRPGEHLPMRPLWSLVERLGTGGHGEAWLARHDKTKERRVYKFAADSEALGTLKREITIYRLLHDSLGERPDLVHLLDWNLEEPPYFLEYDYLEAGSLATWAKAQGGLDRVPLVDRLDIAARIADALGAAHSVGVLHKDLKPSNVLVETRAAGREAGEGPAAGRYIQIKLCDFGSGGVLDVQRLEAMGITRLGFTRTMTLHDAIAGTPLYLAPEVVGGQPFTVKSDIYALGVLLYQLAVGNFNKSLAPGWEQDVPDEVLREDIAIAAEGHPERRIADAARLAQRLRTLDERRRQLEADRAARAEAESAKLQMERMRARRGWVRLALAASLSGAAVSSWLYLRAERAAETTAAVSDFLNNGVLSSADPWKSPIKTMTVKEALDRAAAEAPKRFIDKPEIAAQLHATIGGIYLRMQEYPAAQDHLAQANALYEGLHGPESEERLFALAALAEAQSQQGLTKESCSAYEQILAYRAASGSALDLPVLRARYDVIMCAAMQGHIAAASAELQKLHDEAQRAPSIDEEFLMQLRGSLSEALAQTGQLAEAERLQRQVLKYLSDRYGEAHLRVVMERKNLALLLDKQGGYDEEARQLERALTDLAAWVGDTRAYSIELLTLLGNVRMRQGRPDEAVAMLEDAITRARALYGNEHYLLTQIQSVLATVYQKLKRFKDAQNQLRSALALSLKLFGPEHRFSLDIGIKLAGCMRESGDLRAARAALDGVSTRGLDSLPPKHYLLGGYRRQQGLLALAEGRHDAAKAALAEAVSIYEHSLGPDNDRTSETRAELARAFGTVAVQTRY